jgi:broad specificity phosphatase PhoE
LSLQLNLPVIVAPELRSINLGVLSGIPIDKARTLYPEDSASMDAWRCGGLEIGELKIRGMEDPIEFYLRGLRYLIDALIREDQGSEIIVCTTSIMILFHNLKLRRTPRIGDGYRAKECKNTEVVQLSFEQDDLSWLKREERLWDTFRR